MKIRIRPEDRLFSEYIRTRDGWCCQRCNKWHDPVNLYSRMGLHNSHFHGRGKHSTRFDEMNCHALCYGCHQYFHANPIEHTNWMINKIGQKEFDLLFIRANTPGKPDVKLIKMWLKIELKKMNKKSEGFIIGARS